MCGRYALGIRAAFVRHQLEEDDMPVAEAPDDDEVRQTYNFAPGNHGLVYRADVPDYGAGGRPHEGESRQEGDTNDKKKSTEQTSLDVPAETRYKLQSMKWGLVPFWTKRNPDYASVLKTINARDDSLASKGGMWNTMKQRKRCIVVAQGFYEWLKKNGGKEKIPHFTKRKDGQLMCFAGLWDCVTYGGSDEKHYTYTIITTDSNKQLSFLHDRMPVILENGSDEIRTWLDPGRSEWSKELQSLLKPYQSELECYPVSKEVGKVGNNSPSFVVPVASSENKHNIANFFSNAKKSVKDDQTNKEAKTEGSEAMEKDNAVGKDIDEGRATVEHTGTEDNAPLPVPSKEPAKTGIKRELDVEADDGPNSTSKRLEDLTSPRKSLKKVKIEDHISPTKSVQQAQGRSPEKFTSSKKTRSATTNGTAKGSPNKSSGSQQITSFFK